MTRVGAVWLGDGKREKQMAAARADGQGVGCAVDPTHANVR